MLAKYRDLALIWYFRRGWRGFHFLRRLFSLGSTPTRLLFRTSFSTIFRLDPTSFIDATVLRTGYYEPEVIEALRPYLGSGSVFWDVGSHFGLHAVTVKKLSPETQVIAFEPNPAMHSRIRENATLNACDITLAPIALGNTTGDREFYLIDSGNPGMSTITPWNDAQYDRKITIECSRVDDLIDSGRFPAPTVMKIDVEGAEIEVFEGMKKLLANKLLCAIIFEGWPRLHEPSTAHPLSDLLREAHFQIKPLQQHGSPDHLLENYIATRRS